MKLKSGDLALWKSFKQNPDSTFEFCFNSIKGKIVYKSLVHEQQLVTVLRRDRPNLDALNAISGAGSDCYWVVHCHEFGFLILHSSFLKVVSSLVEEGS